MRSRSPTARPLERRAKNSAAVSGRSIVIMEIRHKRLNAGEAPALARFQFFDRIARRSAAQQLGLQLRLMGLLTRAALEIGRASCTERVCRYVSISGIAVALN